GVERRAGAGAVVVDQEVGDGAVDAGADGVPGGAVPHGDVGCVDLARDFKAAADVEGGAVAAVEDGEAVGGAVRAGEAEVADADGAPGRAVPAGDVVDDLAVDGGEAARGVELALE